MDEYNNLSEEEKKNYDVSHFGEGVELVGYNDETGNVDLTQALTPTSYKFDGIDDYIKIKYDGSKNIEVKDETGAVIKTQDEIEYLMENGLTFEFYGRLKGGKTYNLDNGEEVNSTDERGLFCWRGDMSTMRVGIARKFKKFFWNPCMPRWGYNDIPDTNWQGPNASIESNTVSNWNQVLDLVNYNHEQDNIYFALVVNPEKVEKWHRNDVNVDLDCIEQILYSAKYSEENENLYVNRGLLNKNLWSLLGTYYKGLLNEFYVGVYEMAKPNEWHFTECDAYSLRFYNTALTEEQIEDNYKKTIDYHNLLVSEVTE